jgi:hypothetical protein
MMTRKDSEMIAAAIRKVSEEGGEWEERVYLICEEVAEAIADALETDNPRFNRDMFLRASGLTVQGRP